MPDLGFLIAPWLMLGFAGARIWDEDHTTIAIFIPPLWLGFFQLYLLWLLFIADRLGNQHRWQRDRVAEQMGANLVNRILPTRRTVTQHEVDMVQAFVAAGTEAERRRLLQQMPRELAQDAIQVNRALRNERGAHRVNRNRSTETLDPQPVDYEPEGIDLDPTGLGR